MIALILNNKNTIIESIVMASKTNIKSFFYNNVDADSAILIDRQDHLDGSILIQDSVITTGHYEDEFLSVVLEGVFDIDKYQLIPASDIYDSRIISNLIHVYNGGQLQDVPFPMPYRKEFMNIVNSFNEKEKIYEFTRYSKEQILNF
jgi:hypothetical protein